MQLIYANVRFSERLTERALGNHPRSAPFVLALSGRGSVRVRSQRACKARDYKSPAQNHFVHPSGTGF